jgi:hypothetical protein
MANGTQGKGRKFGRCRDSKAHAAYVAEDRDAKHKRSRIERAAERKIADAEKEMRVPRGSARAARRGNTCQL